MAPIPVRSLKIFAIRTAAPTARDPAAIRAANNVLAMSGVL